MPSGTAQHLLRKWRDLATQTHLDRDSVSLAELVPEMWRAAKTAESAVHQDPQSLAQVFTLVHTADRDTGCEGRVCRRKRGREVHATGNTGRVGISVDSRGSMMRMWIGIGGVDTRNWTFSDRDRYIDRGERESEERVNVWQDMIWNICTVREWLNEGGRAALCEGRGTHGHRVRVRLLGVRQRRGEQYEHG